MSDTFDPSAQAIGRVLTELRDARGHTQAQVAALTGLSQPTISRAERGERRVAYDTVVTLTAAYDVDLSAFNAAVKRVGALIVKRQEVEPAVTAAVRELLPVPE